jgi:hypothetical protein
MGSQDYPGERVVVTPRPASLKDVASQSDSIVAFGHNMRDWLHEVRRSSSRPQLERAYAEEPATLRDRFPQGDVADAWLGAYAEHLASQIGRAPPDWAFHASRIADEPWFAIPTDPRLRALALIHSPLPFRRRNLYTSAVDLPLRLRAGRPRKSSQEKRLSNAERQRRFRKRRRAELKKLRELFAATVEDSP